jgi:hypothetical protein
MNLPITKRHAGHNTEPLVMPRFGDASVQMFLYSHRSLSEFQKDRVDLLGLTQDYGAPAYWLSKARRLYYDMQLSCRRGVINSTRNGEA